MIEFDAGTSSVNKGETLYDTILTMSALGVDICVVRHSEVDYYKQLIDSRTIQTSIVNGGDGSGQHPSQCLLDLMTIYEEFGTFGNLKICIAGDITHSRVAKSNMRILKRLGAQIYFAGPTEWYSSEFDVYGQHVAIDDVIEDLNVLMLLRVQHERHRNDKGFSKEELEEITRIFTRRYSAADFTAEDIRQRINAGYQFFESLPKKRKNIKGVKARLIPLSTPPTPPDEEPDEEDLLGKKQRTSCTVSLHSRERLRDVAPIVAGLRTLLRRPA